MPKYTTEEKQIIVEMTKKCYPVWMIAKKLKRSPQAVQFQIFTKGGYDNYNPEARTQDYKIARYGDTRKNKKPKELNKQITKEESELENKLTELETRIKSIEMQLDILFEIIKEKK